MQLGYKEIAVLQVLSQSSLTNSLAEEGVLVIFSQIFQEIIISNLHSYDKI